MIDTTPFNLTRVWTDADGISHFDEVEVPLADTTGRGHRTRTVDGRPRRSLFVPLA